VTQPLIVAKVGLQSKTPPARNGKPFKSFNEVMAFIIEHEGLPGLFKGIGPQILKGLLVQGFLMMTKERYVSPFRNPITRPPYLTGMLGWNCYSFFCSAMYERSGLRSFRSWRIWLLKEPERQPLSSQNRSLCFHLQGLFVFVWVRGNFISTVYIGMIEASISLSILHTTFYDQVDSYSKISIYSSTYKHLYIYFLLHLYCI
jgi:hypothetical protein